MRMNSDSRLRQITETEIRQIAGRAGRYMEDGQISCMKHRDLMSVITALKDVNINYGKNNQKKIKKEENDEESSSDDEIFENSQLIQKNGNDYGENTSQKLINRKYYVFID